MSITPADWKRLAEQAGLPARLVSQVLETWKGGEEPFLKNVRGDLWTIADSTPRGPGTGRYAAAKAWLDDQAALSKHGRKRGLAAGAKKRGKRKAPKP